MLDPDPADFQQIQIYLDIAMLHSTHKEMVFTADARVVVECKKAEKKFVPSLVTFKIEILIFFQNRHFDENLSKEFGSMWLVNLLFDQIQLQK